MGEGLEMDMENDGSSARSEDKRGESNTIGSVGHAPWCFKKLVEQMEKCGQWLYDHMGYGPIPAGDEAENEIKNWFSLAATLLLMALASIYSVLSLKVNLAVNADKVHLEKTRATLDLLIVMAFIIFALSPTMLWVTVNRPISPRSFKIARTCGRFALVLLLPFFISSVCAVFSVAPNGNL